MLIRTQARFRNARPGSILILVVALLVLMALIGTAALSTNTIDRYATQQNSFNTQIDLLVEGMKNVAKATLVDDLRDSSAAGGLTYRSASDESSYDNWDAVDLTTATTDGTFPRKNDKWLSPRVPLMDTTNGGVVYWPAIGSPLIGTTFTSPFVIEETSRRVPTNITFDYTDRVDGAIRLPSADLGRRLSPIAITEIRDSLGNVVRAFAPALPAWRFTTAGVNYLYVAADADGDGIADGGLFQLPIGQRDGLTYYAAFRIVDNSAAVNVNTAFTYKTDFGADGAPLNPSPVGLFPSNVGLAELLHSNVAGAPAGAGSLGTEMNALNQWRFNLTGTQTMSDGVAGVVGNTTPLQDQPFDDSGSQRDDFRYVSVGDALWSALGRRPENPGYASPTLHYRAFSLGDSAALAYRYVLRNASASTSELESRLNPSLRPPVTAGEPLGRSKPYSAADVATWFNENFNYNAENPSNPSTLMPRRTLLTGVSNASNLIAVKLNSAGGVPLGAAAYNSPNGVYAPKTSINTASFEELRRAFWCVMAFESPSAAGKGQFGDTPYASALGGEPDYTSAPHSYLFQGMQFNAPAPTAAGNSATTQQRREAFASDATQQHQSRMFRSSIRDTRASSINSASTALRLSGKQMVVLRSALAAHNAEIMRSPVLPAANVPAGVARFVEPKTVSIPNDANPSQVDFTVRLYGIQRQPYLTEVYANTDITTVAGGAPQANTSPYVAIELYWPYSEAKPVGNWWIGQVRREANGSVTLREIGRLPAATTFRANGLQNQGSYLLLENYDEGNTAPTNGVFARTPSSQLPSTAPIPAEEAPYQPPRDRVFVQDLHHVITDAANGQELVIFDSDPNTNVDAVPIDSFDFTGLTPGIAGDPANSIPGRADVWHYARKSGSASPYDPTYSSTTGYPLGAMVVYNGITYVARQDATTMRGQEPGVAPTTVWRPLRARPEWRFVYPGRYNGGLADRRHQGTQAGTWDPTDPGQQDPFLSMNATTPGVTLGAFNPFAPVPASNDSFSASYPQSFCVQVMNVDQPGPGGQGSPPAAPPAAAPAVRYTTPFGMFARDADILQVPYFGAYRIFNAAGLVEANSVPMDCAFCEDTDAYDDPVEAEQPYATGAITWQTGVPVEQVGRFIPIAGIKGAYGIQGVGTFLFYYDDTEPGTPLIPAGYADPTVPPNPDQTHAARWRYRWARALLDYLTVLAPHDDYLPNVKPNATTIPPGGTQISPHTWTANEPTPTAPIPVRNGSSPAGDPGSAVPANPTSEFSVPVYGRVNINTAPLKVLAQLPFLPAGVDLGPTSPNGIEDREDVAREIIRYRDGIEPDTGAPFVDPAGERRSPKPLESLFDIYRGENTHALAMAHLTATDPGMPEGDLSPAGGYDGARNDSEEQSLMLARVSNLITTRSDSFTVYVLVQGWRNAGSTDPAKPPELVVQRRAAFIADRSGITASGGQLKVINVPTE